MSEPPQSAEAIPDSGAGGGTAPSFETEVFGKYYLLDRIAVGGMAEIFRAKTYSHGGFEKIQVIKRILSHLSENEDFVSMFIDEANISVSLQHANIVQIYDFGRLDHNYYLAMEWVDGKDVKQILRKLASRRKRLPEEFAIYIAHEMCKGLDYAHKKTNLQGQPLNIVHRDLSPSNILVSYEGEVKIADFGIAKAEMSAYDTKGGVLKGKFEYMSPEQARGENLDQQSDLFTAGIILYELLTGRRLFKTDSELKTLEKVKAVDIQPPSALNPHISPRLDAIVMKALTRTPEERYRTAAEFQDALLAYVYPNTPSVIHKSFCIFIKELFSEEREDERNRLIYGSEQAFSLHSQIPDIYLDDDLELEPTGHTGSGVTGAGTGTGTIQTQPNRTPLLAGVLIAALLALAAFFIGQRPDPVETPPEVVATTGTLKVRIGPVEGVITQGDVELGRGKVVELELDPGEHTIAISAEGHETQTLPVSIAVGEKIVMPITLVPEAVEEPPEDPPEDPGTDPGGSAQDAPREVPDDPPPPDGDGAEAADPTVQFTSDPLGAEISIDGAFAGATPMTWTRGAAGQSYSVTYSKDGYESLTFRIRAPEDGQADTVRKTLTQKAANGKVNINVTPGWGHVYIDGAKLGETTPLSGYTLSAGQHTIRVVNEAAGLDMSKTVTVAAGETARVMFDNN